MHVEFPVRVKESRVTVSHVWIAFLGADCGNVGRIRVLCDRGGGVWCTLGCEVIGLVCGL